MMSIMCCLNSFLRLLSTLLVADSIDLIISMIIYGFECRELSNEKLGDKAKIILTSCGKIMSVRLWIQSSWKVKLDMAFWKSVSNLVYRIFFYVF